MWRVLRPAVAGGRRGAAVPQGRCCCRRRQPLASAAGLCGGKARAERCGGRGWGEGERGAAAEGAGSAGKGGCGGRAVGARELTGTCTRRGRGRQDKGWGGGEGSAGGLRVRVGESLSSYGGGDWHCKCNAALVCRTCAGCGVTKGETWSWVSSPASPSKCYVRRGCPAAAAARAFRETEKKRVRHLTDVAMGLVLWVGNFRNLKEGKPQEIQLAHSLHRVGKPSRLIVSRTLPRTL